ncbi:glycosyltransferase family 9 protein [Methyloversatilis thermotolerans]|uniref:glycosyltransferase family 9 protein n=1 Tax=Methyloversatilis thermotolerans TaxID=1346290 RepID=UPI00035CB06C|nr:glycosyltransferase family 9 protein [Methyloversatilis thermotolerans]
MIHHRSGIGDLVWHIPYIRAIAAHTADGRVSVMAKPSCRAADVLAGESCVAEVIDYDYRPRAGEQRRGRHEGLRGMFELVRSLRSRGFSHVFIFSSRVRYGLMTLAAGIPHRAGFGFGSIERLFLNMPPFIERHAGAGNWVYPEATSFARAHGFVDVAVTPRLAIPAPLIAEVAADIATLRRPVVAMAIGTSEARKDWGSDNFARLAQRLAEAGLGIVLLGGPAELAVGERIVASAGCPPDVVRAFCQRSVLRSAALLTHCALCVGNDTGVLNVAAASGVPALGLFGATRPLAHDPLLDGIEGEGMSAIHPEAVFARIRARLAADQPS